MEARLTGKPDDAQSVQSGLGRGGSKRAFGLRAGRLLHLSIRPTTISANDLNTRMCAEPVR